MASSAHRPSAPNHAHTSTHEHRMTYSRAKTSRVLTVLQICNMASPDLTIFVSRTGIQRLDLASRQRHEWSFCAGFHATQTIRVKPTFNELSHHCHNPKVLSLVEFPIVRPFPLFQVAGTRTPIRQSRQPTQPKPWFPRQSGRANRP